ncbi:MAG TPA: DUF368 domain-containing protein [Candidatus Scatomonas merdavium]|nr:DUF368 domain-containing protein [Candidatus Scatomonas merdavium]
MKKNFIIRGILWILQGVLVGFGAILPGVSGGTLCVAFGMYKPLISVLSEPGKNLKRYWKMLLVFVLGGAIGFIGLSGLADFLMAQNSTAVICAFVGFMIGTYPGLWSDAGKEGRKGSSYLAVIVGLAGMLCLLTFLESLNAMAMPANFWGFLLCGVLWGLSFIVPGLSSSTLIIFFGLYQPMLNGISHLTPGVVLPLAVGALACLLILSRGVNAAFKRFYTGLSHGIFGIVIATTIKIIPFGELGGNVPLYAICIVGGAIVSYLLSYGCSRLEAASGQE